MRGNFACKAAVAVMVTVAWLGTAGCTMSPDECDPSVDPGFANKLGCVMSGSYAKRVQMSEQRISNLRTENARLQQIYRDVSNEQALVNGTRDERLAVLNRIRDETDRYRAAAMSKNALSTELKQRLDNIASAIDQMQSVDPDEQALLEKQAEYEELKRQFSKLLEVHDVRLY